jgi:hypothetical protein
MKRSGKESHRGERSGTQIASSLAN